MALQTSQITTSDKKRYFSQNALTCEHWYKQKFQKAQSVQISNHVYQLPAVATVARPVTGCNNVIPDDLEPITEAVPFGITFVPISEAGDTTL